AGTTAVQQNQTIIVNNNYISEPAPRVVLSLTEIARKLHPEAMQSANLSETPIGSATPDMGNVTTQSATGSNATGATAGTAATASGETTVGAATSSTETTAGGAATTAGDSAGTAAGTDRAGNASGGNASAETTSSDGPGFGVAVAAIALLGGTLLARRR